MTDIYLKTDTKESMDSALLGARLINSAGVPAEGVDLDRIGQISFVTGYDEAGEALIQSYDGYHANVRTTFDFDVTRLDPSVVVSTPATPFRVWG